MIQFTWLFYTYGAGKRIWIFHNDYQFSEQSGSYRGSSFLTDPEYREDPVSSQIQSTEPDFNFHDNYQFLEQSGSYGGSSLLTDPE